MQNTRQRLQWLTENYEANRNNWQEFVQAIGLNSIPAEGISDRYLLSVVGRAIDLSYRYLAEARKGLITYSLLDAAGKSERAFCLLVDRHGNLCHPQNERNCYGATKIPEELPELHATAILELLEPKDR